MPWLRRLQESRQRMLRVAVEDDLDDVSNRLDAAMVEAAAA
jgi:hypothetical protein